MHENSLKDYLIAITYLKPNLVNNTFNTALTSERITKPTIQSL